MNNFNDPAVKAANMAANEASAKARDAERQVDFMRRDVDRLLMITEALWRLLQRAHGYTDEDLKKLIAEIDLEDGVLNGRVARRLVSSCPACQRPVSAKDTKCIYCGQALEPEPFAR